MFYLILLCFVSFFSLVIFLLFSLYISLHCFTVLLSAYLKLFFVRVSSYCFVFYFRLTFRGNLFYAAHYFKLRIFMLVFNVLVALLIILFHFILYNALNTVPVCNARFVFWPHFYVYLSCSWVLFSEYERHLAHKRFIIKILLHNLL